MAQPGSRSVGSPLLLAPSLSNKSSGLASGKSQLPSFTVPPLSLSFFSWGTTYPPRSKNPKAQGRD